VGADRWPPTAQVSSRDFISIQNEPDFFNAGWRLGQPVPRAPPTPGTVPPMPWRRDPGLDPGDATADHRARDRGVATTSSATSPT
jgi:hypothetical protein